MSDFESDKSDLLGQLKRARGKLDAVVIRLASDDLARARRGSWPVSRILDHVLHSERLYTQLISVFSGVGTSAEPTATPATPVEAIEALKATRHALLDAAGQVDETDFYRLQTIGHEEYSVLSILENVASHDREHAEQIRRTIES